MSNETAEQVLLTRVLGEHQIQHHHAGDGYIEPRESWVECSCAPNEPLWAWQQFYAENESDPEETFRDHVATELAAALRSAGLLVEGDGCGCPDSRDCCESEADLTPITGGSADDVLDVQTGCRPGCKPGGACKWIGCTNADVADAFCSECESLMVEDYGSGHLCPVCDQHESCEGFPCSGYDGGSCVLNEPRSSR